MKLLLLAVAAASWAAALVSGHASRATKWVFVLSGDTDGYLAPCGCTKPMSGGVRRRASAVRALTAGSSFVHLDNGSLSAGKGRQDHLKAEALAEMLEAMEVTAIQLTPADARLGPGLAISVLQIAEGRVITGSVEPSSRIEIPAHVAKGPFLIGAATTQPDGLASSLGERPVDTVEAVRRLVEAAAARKLIPVLMLHGNRDQAREVAKAFPQLRLIQYRSASLPSEGLEFEGAAALASSGDKAKHVVRLTWDGAKFCDYAAIDLGPEFKDDPAAAKIYREYLARVESEQLLDKVPRREGGGYIGNEPCGSCHSEALEVWKRSKHASALKTLEDDGHGRDPDCVGCHVVALDRTGGFRSRQQTPALADVGCESCHGPGLEHSQDPYRVRLGPAGAKSCAPCHVPEHSPGFEFQSYWKRIEHK